MSKNIGGFVLIGLLSVSSFSCGSKEADKENEVAQKTNGADSSKKSEEEAPTINVSDEMKDFLDNLGSSDNVTAALKKYGVDGLETNDMGIYILNKSKVIKVEEKGSETYCTMEAESGIMIRTFILGWKDGKIISVEDKGAR